MPAGPAGTEPTAEEQAAHADDAKADTGKDNQQATDDGDSGATEATPAGSSSPVVIPEMEIETGASNPVVIDDLEIETGGASTPPPSSHPVEIPEMTIETGPSPTDSGESGAVQRRAEGSVAAADPVAVATRATAGSGASMPYLGEIQTSFGHHDVSGIRYHDGSAAQEGAAALGAKAFAVGDAVAFKGSPDLHTAAHEAAHVVQQRAGLRPSGGMDTGPTDALEQDADAVADAVVAGRSAAPLLDSMTGGRGPNATAGVQRAGDAPTITSFAAFAAPGQAGDRFIVGVGEQLSFTSDQEGDWTATGGEPTSASATAGIGWTAPGRAGQFTIKVKANGKEASKDIAVVEPSKVLMANATSEISDSGGIGFKMGVGMTVLPTNVSFEGITIREIPGDPAVATGYFKVAASKGLDIRHHPKETPTTIDPGNQAGVDGADFADTLADGKLPRPISVGTLTWHIPYAYTCGDVKDKVFTIVAQTVSIVDSKGTVTITKGAAGDSRGPTAPKTQLTERREKDEAAKAAKGSTGSGSAGSGSAGRGGSGAAGYGVGGGHDGGYARGDGNPAPAGPAQGETRSAQRAAGGATHATITSKTAAIAADGADDRTTVGVGEKVKLTSDVAGKWKASEVGPKGNKEPPKESTTYQWVAPTTPGSVTITFTDKDGHSQTTTMTVIAPTVDYKFPKKLEYAAGKQGAGMVTQVRFEPYSVSFINTEWFEVPGPATSIQGYFTTNAPPYHNPNKNWLPITGSMNDGPTDTAAFWGFPAPWSAGSFQWVIPTKYRVKGEGGDGHKIADVVQSCQMQGGSAAGTTTVTKGTSSVSRATSEAPTPKKGKKKAKGHGAGEAAAGFGLGDGNSTAPAATFSPDMIKTATGKVNKAGSVQTVEAMIVGDDVVAQSPGIMMTATVVLKPGVDPGPTPVMAGWVQTVLSSKRAAVYSKDGKVVRKDIIAFSSTRDAKRGVAAPWYETPSTLSKSTRSAFPIVEDQPKIQFPKKIGDATVSALEGADSFNVSLKTGTDPASLTTHESFAWQVPWNVSVDAAGGTITKGGDLGISAASGGVDPANTTPANERGSDPKNRIKTYETEDAALEALNSGYEAFLRDMPRHEKMAPDSYWKMVGALWKSGKKAYVKLHPVSGGTGEFTAELKCDKTQGLGTIKSDSSKHGVLAHMVYDPAKLVPGSTIVLMINGASVAFLRWPFAKQTTNDVSITDTTGIFNDDHVVNVEMGIE